MAGGKMREAIEAIDSGKMLSPEKEAEAARDARLAGLFQDELEALSRSFAARHPEAVDAEFAAITERLCRLASRAGMGSEDLAAYVEDLHKMFLAQRSKGLLREMGS